MVCWFLCKNLSNFVYPVWKLHNPYCHNVSTYVLLSQKPVRINFFSPLVPSLLIDPNQRYIRQKKSSHSDGPNKPISFAILHFVVVCSYDWEFFLEMFLPTYISTWFTLTRFLVSRKIPPTYRLLGHHDY